MNDQTTNPEVTIEKGQEVMPENIHVKNFEGYIFIGKEPCEIEGKSSSKIIINGNGGDLLTAIINAFDSSKDFKHLFKQAYLLHELGNFDEK
jgi:hypothetical protein